MQGSGAEDDGGTASGEMMAALARFLAFAKTYRGWWLLTLFFFAVEVAFGIFLPLSLQFFIDKVIEPKDTGMLAVIMAALAGAFAFSVAARVLRDWVFSKTIAHIFSDIYRAMFDRLQLLSPRYFHRVPTAGILARFTTDMVAVETAVVLSLPLALLAILHIVGGLAVLLVLEWHLALLALVGIPISLVGPRLLGPKALAVGGSHQQQQEEMLGMVQESLAAQAVVRVFRLKDVRGRAFAGRAARLAALGTRYRFLTYLTEHTPNFGLQFFTLAVIGGGGYLVTRDALSVGALVAFNGVFLNMSLWFAELSYIAPSVIQASGGLRRIGEMLDEAPDMVDGPGDARPPAVGGGPIRFDDVTFSYAGGSSAGGQPNLAGVSYEVPAGARVAFVGPSGSGKSTNLNLIMRFYDPDQGRVLMGGVDLRSLPRDLLYRQMGTVFQESFLFNTSIRENIRMGNPGAGDDAVVAAAKAAELHDIVMHLPEGYDTPVGERGDRLSGGQRQRVAIARALIGNPSILILDEATSALDPATEEAVNATLERISAGKTVLTVTHRLPSVAGYDQILVFDRGQLVEDGTHESLLARGGLYANLWRRQVGLSVSPDGRNASVTAESLREFPLFADMALDDLGRIASEFVTEHAAAGRDVIVQGELGSKFFIIVRGRVSVLIDQGDGRPSEVAALASGEYFGEMALLADTVTAATVRTVSDSIFLVLPKSSFQRVLHALPHLRAVVAATAESRLADNASRRETVGA
ncbi:MAG: ATP-binding cassette domain-containing protein [Solirubrobacterales bacterium]